MRVVAGEQCLAESIEGVGSARRDDVQQLADLLRARQTRLQNVTSLGVVVELIKELFV